MSRPAWLPSATDDPCDVNKAAHAQLSSQRHGAGGTFAVALLAVALLLVACAGGPGGAGGDQPAPPAGAPYISGAVTSVTPFTPITEDCVDGSDLDPDGSVSSDDPPICSPDDGPQGSILVEELPDGNKASLTIAQTTGIWRETADGVEPAAFTDLAEGQTVAAWVSGPVAESFPVQATADDVVIRSP
jgi:hypothetical protein